MNMIFIDCKFHGFLLARAARTYIYYNMVLQVEICLKFRSAHS